MKYVLSLLCLLVMQQPFAQSSAFTPVLNAYGEVKTKIYRGSAIQGWTDRILPANKSTIEKKLGEGMYHEIYNHSNINQWPYQINDIKRLSFTDPVFENYVVYFMLQFDQYAIMRVPYEENKQLPSKYLLSDKTDFYFVIFDNSVANLDECMKAATNSSLKYPESSYARNIKQGQSTDNVPGAEEFNKAIAAEDKKEYKEAIDWYKKAAEKNLSTAMHNIGILYYNNTTGQEYNSQSVLEQVRGSKSAETKRYQEAMKWFEKAAEKGFAASMYEIGLLYKDGKGVDVNKTEARKWLQKAADKGHEKAKKNLLSL